MRAAISARWCSAVHALLVMPCCADWQGSMVRHLIESYWKDVHLRHGYELIYSPHIAKARSSDSN